MFQPAAPFFLIYVSFWEKEKFSERVFMGMTIKIQIGLYYTGCTEPQFSCLNIPADSSLSWVGLGRTGWQRLASGML